MTRFRAIASVTGTVIPARVASACGSRSGATPSGSAWSRPPSARGGAYRAAVTRAGVYRAAFRGAAGPAVRITG